MAKASSLSPTSSFSKWEHVRRSSEIQITLISDRVNAIANMPMDDALQDEIKNIIDSLDHHWDIVQKMVDKIVDALPSHDVDLMDAELTLRNDIEDAVYATRLTAFTIQNAYSKKKQASPMQKIILDRAEEIESRFRIMLATIMQSEGVGSGTTHSSLPQTTAKQLTISVAPPPPPQQQQVHPLPQPTGDNPKGGEDDSRDTPKKN